MKPTPITFIDKAVKKNELGHPFSLSDHQREILRLAFAFDRQGKLPWDTIIYSCVKKSGKTTLNGALTLAWGFIEEAPNEILVLANDLEQSLARVFKTMEGIIKHNLQLSREAEVQTKTIFLANGTTITAISGDYAGAAGSNHGWLSYDELWAYTSESSRRLWEELTPVPTRKNSIRFITTYAGFEGESELLMDLYKQVVSTDEHPEGQGERIHPDLPIYANREARIFAYWDHEPRMPWQSPATRARKKCCAPARICACIKTNGRRQRKFSSRRKCGIPTSTLSIIQALPAASRFTSVSTPGSSTTTPREWRLSGMRTAKS
jgi:hypothetical protein